MPLTLDHIFVITCPGAPVGDQLLDLRWVEGSANSHAGQGTANRRFFFDEFVLEFLFVADVDEALNGAGRNLKIQQRSVQAGACPVGLVVRSQSEPVFPHWKYYPDYFGGKMSFYVGENSDNFSEPLCICMPIDLPKKPAVSGANADVLSNPAVLSAVELALPVAEMSCVLETFAEIDNLRVRTDREQRLTLVFNEGVAGHSKELHADYPITIRW